jgi:2-polyprenyl-3-methyl-5-hydroxy-6-metoxy-1,4-benzoquinol methylase
MSQPPTVQETETEKIESPTASRRAEVRDYFTEPRNFLNIRRYVIEIRKETVRDFTAGRAFRNILDIGCGDGSVSMQFLDAANRLTLLDISDAMLSRALSKVRPELLENVDTINQDFLTATLKPDSYDLIICVGVLAHVERTEPLLEKIEQLLRPGGLLVLECTDCAHFTLQFSLMVGRIRGLFKKGSGYRTRLISAASVLAIAQQSGLKLISEYRHNLALPLMGKVFSQAALQRIIRLIFGTAKRNRNAWLGKECIFAFELDRQTIRQKP